MKKNEINIEKFIKPYNDKLKYLIENNLIKYEWNSLKFDDDDDVIFENCSLSFSLKEGYEDDLIVSIDGKEYKMHLPYFEMIQLDNGVTKEQLDEFDIRIFIEKEYAHLYNTVSDLSTVIKAIEDIIEHEYCMTCDKLDPENYNYILKCANEKPI